MADLVHGPLFQTTNQLTDSELIPLKAAQSSSDANHAFAIGL